MTIINLSANASLDDPIAIFSQFLTNELFKTIVQHINKYAKLKQLKDCIAESCYWHLVTFGEMCRFIVIQIYMGIYPIANTEEYWNMEGNVAPMHEGI